VAAAPAAVAAGVDKEAEVEVEAAGEVAVSDGACKAANAIASVVMYESLPISGRLCINSGPRRVMRRWTDLDGLMSQAFLLTLCFRFLC